MRLPRPSSNASFGKLERVRSTLAHHKRGQWIGQDEPCEVGAGELPGVTSAAWPPTSSIPWKQAPDCATRAALALGGGPRSSVFRGAIQLKSGTGCDVDDLGPLAAWIPREVITDARGRLSTFAFGGIPFEPQRLFVVTDVSPGTSRGGHGHRTGIQLMACVSGRIRIELATSDHRTVAHCESDGPALLVHAGVLARQTYLTAGSALLVICSEPFDPDSYIADPEILKP